MTYLEISIGFFSWFTYLIVSLTYKSFMAFMIQEKSHAHNIFKTLGVGGHDQPWHPKNFVQLIWLVLYIFETVVRCACKSSWLACCKWRAMYVISLKQSWGWPALVPWKLCALIWPVLYIFETVCEAYHWCGIGWSSNSRKAILFLIKDAISAGDLLKLRSATTPYEYVDTPKDQSLTFLNVFCVAFVLHFHGSEYHAYQILHKCQTFGD